MKIKLTGIELLKLSYEESFGIDEWILRLEELKLCAKEQGFKDE